MANELTGSPTLRLPDELALEFKRREFAALMRPRAVGLSGLGRGGRALALRLAERGMRVTLLHSEGSDVAQAATELEALLPEVDASANDGGARIVPGDESAVLRGHELIIDVAGSSLDTERRHSSYRRLMSRAEADIPLAVVVGSQEEAVSLDAMGPGASRLVPIHMPLGEYGAPVVEVIRAPYVHRSAMVRAQRVFDAAGLFVVRSPAVPGFLVDRLYLAALAEACRLIAGGLTDIESVDRTFRIHTLNNLGLLQVADLMGIDAVVALYDSLASGTGESRYAPPRLLRAYLEQGFLGRKSGRGFYQYGSFSS